MKKFLLFICALSILPLSGCENTSAEGSGTSGNYTAAPSESRAITVDRPIRMAGDLNFLQCTEVSGIPVTQEVVDWEKFALTVLSNDKNYDVFFIYSRAPWAAEIRDKGVFYPLNGVDGAEEYLDACFPFVKEAATDKNGKIWMLPLKIKPYYLCYNKENCRKNGISFSDGMTAEDIVDIITGQYEKGNYNYTVNGYVYTENLLSDYILSRGKFDTQEFRALAEFIKNRIYANDDAFSQYVASEHQNESFTFLLGDELVWYLSRIWGENAAAMELPLKSGDKNIETCYFICVNPYSDNLENALRYVTAFTAQTLEKSRREDFNDISEYFDEVSMIRDAAVFGKSGFFSDLRDIYGGGVIRFMYPNEIFLQSFYDYLDGGTTLEEFISGADRRLSMYLNE